jgi:hypothetical protein
LKFRQAQYKADHNHVALGGFDRLNHRSGRQCAEAGCGEVVAFLETTLPLVVSTGSTTTLVCKSLAQMKKLHKTLHIPAAMLLMAE